MKVLWSDSTAIKHLASTQLAVFGGGCFFSKGTGQLLRIKGTMEGGMYRQGQGIEASQGIENGSWMGIPA